MLKEWLRTCGTSLGGMLPSFHAISSSSNLAALQRVPPFTAYKTISFLWPFRRFFAICWAISNIKRCLKSAESAHITPNFYFPIIYPFSVLSFFSIYYKHMPFTLLDYLGFSLSFINPFSWQKFEPETLKPLEKVFWAATYPSNELSDFLSNCVYFALLRSHV